MIVQGVVALAIGLAVGVPLGALGAYLSLRPARRRRECGCGHSRDYHPGAGKCRAWVDQPNQGIRYTSAAPMSYSQVRCVCQRYDGPGASLETSAMGNDT